MRQVVTFDHLQAVPICVVLRTARGVVVERTEGGWSQMGSENTWIFNKRLDFPARVLWTYHDEIVADPDYIDPDKAVEFVRQLQRAQSQAAAEPPAEEVDSTGNTETPEGDDEAVDQAGVAHGSADVSGLSGRDHVGVHLPDTTDQGSDPHDGSPHREAGIQHDGDPA